MVSVAVHITIAYFVVHSDLRLALYSFLLKLVRLNEQLPEKLNKCAKNGINPIAPKIKLVRKRLV